MKSFTCYAEVGDGTRDISVGYDTQRIDWAYGMHLATTGVSGDRTVGVVDFCLLGEDWVRVLYLEDSTEEPAAVLALFMRQDGSEAVIGTWRALMQRPRSPQEFRELTKLPQPASPSELTDLRAVRLDSFDLEI